MTWKDGKSDGYTWANAPYYTGNGSTHSWSKYTDSDYTVLQPEDDAATVQLGSSWRMPTIGDWNELNNPDNTTWTWENGSGSSGLSTGGVKGYKVAKKTDSSVYIFLPAAGYRNATHVTNQGASGRYWSSSLYTPNTLHGRCFEFDSSNRYASSNSRNYGFTVRPVQ